MSGRDSKPQKPASPRLPNFLNRTRAMSSSGSSGWEATSIGFTLVGSIVACAALGYWLDGHFKTNFWLPVLFLVGVGAGFREMFVVLGRISREEEQRKREKQSNTPLAPTPVMDSEIPVEAPPRERIFKVPPPPVSGEKIAATSPESDANGESVNELIEKLLSEDDKDTK